MPAAVFVRRFGPRGYFFFFLVAGFFLAAFFFPAMWIHPLRPDARHDGRSK
jgi:hypothetical protein